MFTTVLVLAGQPALTATALAWACNLASAAVAAVVVLVVVLPTLDCEDTGVLFPPETMKAIATMTPATTTTMIALRICLRRFCCLASAASRASLAARWRALLSLGTARDPTQSPGCPRIAHPGRRGVGARGGCRGGGGRPAAMGRVRSL